MCPFLILNVSAWGTSDCESSLLLWRRMGGTEPEMLCKDIYIFMLTKDEKINVSAGGLYVLN